MNRTKNITQHLVVNWCKNWIILWITIELRDTKLKEKIGENGMLLFVHVCVLICVCVCSCVCACMQRFTIRLKKHGQVSWLSLPPSLMF